MSIAPDGISDAYIMQCVHNRFYLESSVLTLPVMK